MLRCFLKMILPVFHIIVLTRKKYVCVRVCMCVRENERGKVTTYLFWYFMLFVSSKALLYI